MPETHFQAKLTKIAVGRQKGIAAPVLTFTLVPTYEPTLTQLSRDTGNAFSMRVLPLELDLFGVDAGLTAPTMKCELAKVNVTPPKEDLGPTMQISIVAIYSFDGMRLVSRVGQRVAVTLESAQDEARIPDDDESSDGGPLESAGNRVLVAHAKQARSRIAKSEMN